MKGIAITLKKKTKTGTDAFGQDIYTETDVQVNDVLVGEPSAEDVQTAIVRYGKKIAYTLAIPKGDTNDWYKSKVVLWGDGSVYRELMCSDDLADACFYLMENKDFQEI